VVVEGENFWYKFLRSGEIYNTLFLQYKHGDIVYGAREVVGKAGNEWTS
jgi:hypothetical protein